MRIKADAHYALYSFTLFLIDGRSRLRFIFINSTNQQISREMQNLFSTSEYYVVPIRTCDF